MFQQVFSCSDVSGANVIVNVGELIRLQSSYINTPAAEPAASTLPQRLELHGKAPLASVMLSGELVAVWDMDLSDGVHRIQFAHGTTTGKRLVFVNGQVRSKFTPRQCSNMNSSSSSSCYFCRHVPLSLA